MSKQPIDSRSRNSISEETLKKLLKHFRERLKKLKPEHPQFAFLQAWLAKEIAYLEKQLEK